MSTINTHVLAKQAKILFGRVEASVAREGRSSHPPFGPLFLLHHSREPTATYAMTRVQIRRTQKSFRRSKACVVGIKKPPSIQAFVLPPAHHSQGKGKHPPTPPTTLFRLGSFASFGIALSSRMLFFSKSMPVFSLCSFVCFFLFSSLSLTRSSSQAYKVGTVNRVRARCLKENMYRFG